MAFGVHATSVALFEDEPSLLLHSDLCGWWGRNRKAKSPLHWRIAMYVDNPRAGDEVSIVVFVPYVQIIHSFGSFVAGAVSGGAGFA